MAQTYPIYAVYVGRGIRLSEAEKLAEDYILISKKRNLLQFEIAKNEHLFIYSFGVFVFIGVDKRFYKKISKKFERSVIDPSVKEISDEYAILDGAEKDSVEETQVKLKDFSPDRISLVAEVLAQSIAIEHFDLKTDEIVASFEKINSSLEKNGRLEIKSREIIKTVGAANSILQSMITRLSLLDQPDIVWDKQELESFYKNMRSFYTLDDRFRNIEFKIDYIKSTSETILTLLQHRRDVALELVVIVLILIEVILFVGEMMVK